jgi:hypothetical protein
LAPGPPPGGRGAAARRLSGGGRPAAGERPWPGPDRGPLCAG